MLLCLTVGATAAARSASDASSVLTPAHDGVGASAAPAHAASSRVKILWQFWAQGAADLEGRTDREYGAASRCSSYWRRANPGWEWRLLND